MGSWDVAAACLVIRPLRAVPVARLGPFPIASSLVLTAVAAGAVLVRLAMWWTGRTFEDALITTAHDRSLAEGIGLTHHPGEPLTHGFTSALSVLIPLPAELLAPGAGLQVMRGVSVLCALMAIAFAWRICLRLGFKREAAALVCGFLAFDQLQILYGMAGMETEVAVSILLAGIWYVGERNVAASGVLLGLAVFVRPDFLLWVAPATMALWRQQGREATRSLGIALAVVAPWVVFAALYYGSPIPQTIIAKSAAFANYPASIADVPTWLAMQAVAHVPILLRTFTPFYSDSAVVSAPMLGSGWLAVGVVALGLGLRGALLLRHETTFQAALGFAGVYLAYRVLLLPPTYYDWYVPPFTAVTIFLIAAPISRLAPWVRRATVVALLAAWSIHLPFTTMLEQITQHDIEDASRLPAALYLKSHVPPGEAVVAESAGYFGYYGRITLWDYPGLTSPTSLRAERSLPKGDTQPAAVARLADALKPPWLVLRPAEFTALQTLAPQTSRKYALCAEFGPGGEERVAWGGLVRISIDRRFLVLRQGECPPS